MISTLNQYFFVTICVLFLAGSLVKAGEHGGKTEAVKGRELASVVKEVSDEKSASDVSKEDEKKLIDSYDKVQGTLKQFKTGNISEQIED